ETLLRYRHIFQPVLLHTLCPLPLQSIHCHTDSSPGTYQGAGGWKFPLSDRSEQKSESLTEGSGSSNYSGIYCTTGLAEKYGADKIFSVSEAAPAPMPVQTQQSAPCLPERLHGTSDT